MGKREKELVSRIDALRNEAAGYRETLSAMNALLTAVIMQAGPMTISQDTVHDVMQAEAFAVGRYDAEKRAYVIHMPEGVKTDGEGRDACQQG